MSIPFHTIPETAVLGDVQGFSPEYNPRVVTMTFTRHLTANEDLPGLNGPIASKTLHEPYANNRRPNERNGLAAFDTVDKLGFRPTFQLNHREIRRPWLDSLVHCVSNHPHDEFFGKRVAPSTGVQQHFQDLLRYGTDRLHLVTALLVRNSLPPSFWKLAKPFQAKWELRVLLMTQARILIVPGTLAATLLGLLILPPLRTGRLRRKTHLFGADSAQMLGDEVTSLLDEIDKCSTLILPVPQRSPTLRSRWRTVDRNDRAFQPPDLVGRVHSLVAASETNPTVRLYSLDLSTEIRQTGPMAFKTQIGYSSSNAVLKTITAAERIVESILNSDRITERPSTYGHLRETGSVLIMIEPALVSASTFILPPVEADLVDLGSFASTLSSVTFLAPFARVSFLTRAFLTLFTTFAPRGARALKGINPSGAFRLGLVLDSQTSSLQPLRVMVIHTCRRATAIPAGAIVPR